MRAFAVPEVQSARNYRVKEGSGGSTRNAATVQLQGLSTEPRIARRALSN